LLVLAVVFFGVAIVLLRIGSRWAADWQSHAVQRSGIFCYRGVLRHWLDAGTT
jgi:hypothetical protein